MAPDITSFLSYYVPEAVGRLPSWHDWQCWAACCAMSWTAVFTRLMRKVVVEPSQAAGTKLEFDNVVAMALG